MAVSRSATRPDAIRRHNLAVMLAHIHHDGALTRAELTQRLGVSRSTVGSLVADLSQLDLVEESRPAGGAGVGRPSHVVGPHPGGPFAVAVDVDVNRVTVATVGLGGAILSREAVVMRPGFGHDEVAHVVADRVRSLDRAGVPGASGASGASGAWPVGVGVSVPGIVDRADGHVLVAPNLGWHDAPLGSDLATMLPGELPASVSNDADLAVLAEYLRGNARGCEDVVYVFGRAGVGAGLIAGGVHLRGHDGFAGEIGHDVVDATGPACHCGNRGCVETYVGDGALLAAAGVPGPPTDQAVAAVFAAARAGDAAALGAVRRVATALGRAVAGLVNALNPQRLLLGGSLAHLLDIARSDIEESLAQYALASAGGTVQLLPPGLGDDSLLLGAAEVAFGPLLDDPLGAGCGADRAARMALHK